MSTGQITVADLRERLLNAAAEMEDAADERFNACAMDAAAFLDARASGLRLAVGFIDDAWKEQP